MVNWLSPVVVLLAATPFTSGAALPLPLGPGGAAAATNTRRDVNTVLGNLQTIATEANALTSTITAWDGSLLGALGIASAATTLKTSVDDANTEAATETQFSSADSQTIITYVTGTFNPATEGALAALVARQPDVAALGVNSVVLARVQALETSVDALGATLVGLSSADTQAAAQAAVDALDASFDTTLAAYA